MTTIVPSKIILFGEHSIVYPGNKAIISSLGLYTKVNIERNETDNICIRILIDSEQNVLTFSINEAIDSFNKAKNLHNEFKITKDLIPLKAFMSKDLNSYKIIIGLIASKIRIKPFDMLISIEAPIGSGMGTSASISAGIIASVYKEFREQLSIEDLFIITKEIENFQHGNSSGADPAGVINGGTIIYEHKINGERIFSKFKPKPDWKKDLYLINTGKPNDSTGEVISYVHSRYDTEETEIKRIFKEITNISTSFKNNNYNDISELINRNGVLLEKLGIVCKNVINFSEQIRKLGGSVKVCGGGGRIGNSSGLVLCKMKDKETLLKITKDFGFSCIDTKFNVKGINI